MTIKHAKTLAEISSVEDMTAMFNKAKENILDWTKSSNVNKGMTKGVSWNIFSKIPVEKLTGMGKINAIREFGEYLPKYKREYKKKPVIYVHHEEPDFLKTDKIKQYET